MTMHPYRNTAFVIVLNHLIEIQSPRVNQGEIADRIGKQRNWFSMIACGRDALPLADFVPTMRALKVARNAYGTMLALATAAYGGNRIWLAFRTVSGDFDEQAGEVALVDEWRAGSIKATEVARAIREHEPGAIERFARSVYAPEAMRQR